MLAHTRTLHFQGRVQDPFTQHTVIGGVLSLAINNRTPAPGKGNPAGGCRVDYGTADTGSQ